MAQTIRTIILNAFETVASSPMSNTKGCALLEKRLEERLEQVVRFVHVNNANDHRFGEKGYIVNINGEEYYLGTNRFGSYVKHIKELQYNENDTYVATTS